MFNDTPAQKTDRLLGGYIGKGEMHGRCQNKCTIELMYEQNSRYLKFTLKSADVFVPICNSCTQFILCICVCVHKCIGVHVREIYICICVGVGCVYEYL